MKGSYSYTNPPGTLDIDGMPSVPNPSPSLRQTLASCILREKEKEIYEPIPLPLPTRKYFPKRRKEFKNPGLVLEHYLKVQRTLIQDIGRDTQVCR